MRNVYVVTHPEATHHVQDRVGGWFDSDLTSRGLLDAVRVADALLGRIADPSAVALYTSDLRRTTQTAAAIAERFGLTAVPMALLREKSYGEAEGMANAWLRERFVPPPRHGERMDHHEGLTGAETKAAWVRRVYRAMDRITDDDASETVIVTHGGSATFVIAHWIGMPIGAVDYVRFRVAPGSITHLQDDDYFHNRSVVTLNDTSHLAR
jgi:2,3-bisphosphoglycerate-dependent phosphoglycerate mutase